MLEYLYLKIIVDLLLIVFVEFPIYSLNSQKKKKKKNLQKQVNKTWLSDQGLGEA